MKTSICFQCKCQALCPTGQVQSREATVSAITGCSRFESKDKQTNADRLRVMTNEELAEWIYKVQDEDALRKGNYLPPLSKSWWLDWLKQEVKCENS